MKTKVYRVQNEKGEGPYRNQLSAAFKIAIDASSDSFGDCSPRHPIPRLDFDQSVWNYAIRDMYKFAFPWLDAAISWFPPDVLAKFEQHGFYLYEMEVEGMRMSNSCRQCIFLKGTDRVVARLSASQLSSQYSTERSSYVSDSFI